MIRSQHQHRFQRWSLKQHFHFPKDHQASVNFTDPGSSASKAIALSAQQTLHLQHMHEAQQGSWSAAVPPSAAAFRKRQSPGKAFQSAVSALHMPCIPTWCLAQCGGCLVLFSISFHFSCCIFSALHDIWFRTGAGYGPVTWWQDQGPLQELCTDIRRAFSTKWSKCLGMFGGENWKSSICIIRHVWTCIHTVLRCLILFDTFSDFSAFLGTKYSSIGLHPWLHLCIAPFEHSGETHR